MVPNVRTYITMLDGYHKKGYMREAMQIFNEMAEKGLTMDARTFSQVIVVCYKAGLPINVDYFIKGDLNRNLVLDCTKFSMLIKGFCQEGRIQDALILHDEMVRRELVPDASTYNELVNGLCKEKNMQKTKGIFNSLLENELSVAVTN